jgi:hypothetical protein
MKKLIFYLMILFLPALTWAQGTPLSSFYDKYVTVPGFETTEIKPGSMSFEWEKSIDNPRIMDMLKDIESIRILKYKSAESGADMGKIWKKIQKASAEDIYTEVVSVNADNLMMKTFMVKNPDGITREVAMIMKDNEGFMVATMTGNMNFSSMFSPENMKAMREMSEYFMQTKGSCKEEVH